MDETPPGRLGGVEHSASRVTLGVFIVELPHPRPDLLLPGPAVTGTAVAVDVGGGGAGAPLVVQSSAVLGVAMETLNSLLRACSLEAFEGSLQELGVVESDDLRTLSDEQLNSLGMKPVEIERLRRRLQ